MSPALFVVACIGCSTIVPARHGSGHVVRIDVPSMLQNAPTYCGIASLDMLTAYYKHPLGPDAEKGLKDEATQTGGISGKSLELALVEDGYDVFVFPGTLDRQESGLYRQMDLGRPVIVMTGTGPRHYSVVAGYDENAARIVVLDPASGVTNVPIADFTRDWKEANDFCLLAIPKDKTE